MVLALDAQLRRIEAGEIGEAAVYAAERLGADRRRRGVRDGVLECPLCGRRAVQFLPFGLAGRRNARCPTCGSVERHRFLWLFLGLRTRLLQERLRVLHTAAEPCLERLLRPLPNWRYATVDRYDPASDIRADLTDLPVADASIDLVLSSHVLEHVPQHRQAMAELARVLRPGGRALILVPYDPGLAATLEGADVSLPAERMRRFGHPFHFRNYGRDFPAMLMAAGLEPIVVRSKRMLTPHQRRRFRVNDNHLFWCRRLNLIPPDAFFFDARLKPGMRSAALGADAVKGTTGPGRAATGPPRSAPTPPASRGSDHAG